MTALIEVKTSDLAGEALNWAVAKSVPQKHWPVIIRGKVMLDTDFEHYRYSPSTDWCQGGSLISSQQINLEWDGVDGKALWWKATHQDIIQFQMGETPLIAACRAIVSAKLGETVSVPAELMP